MRSQRKITLLVMVGVLLLVAAPIPLAVHAQPSRTAADDPFGKLLAMVPNDEIGHGEFTELAYTNYRALAEAWEVSGLTYDDVLNGTGNSALWLTLTAASDTLTVENTPAFFAGMQDALGFTMLNVDQAVWYGWPPLHGYVVVGNFDLDAVRAALDLRGFSPTKMNDIEMWCGETGCDHGKEQNFQQVNSANIFGGRLGRSEPIALLPGLLLDSPSLDTLGGLIGVQVQQQSSLLDVADYRAFLETITAQGTVLEAYTVNPNLIYTWEQFPLPSDRRDRVIASVKAFGELPVYKFVGMAHVWNDGEFYAEIILLYDDVTTAEIASQEVYTRLAHAMPMSSGSYQSYQEQYAQAASGELLPPTVIEGQGYAAAVVGWRWDRPAGEVEVQNPYRLLRASILHRDVYYLGTNFVLPEQ